MPIYDIYSVVTFYIVGEPSYTGTPSDAIDRAWHDLLGDRYFRSSHDETLYLDSQVDGNEPVTELPEVENVVSAARVYGDVHDALTALSECGADAAILITIKGLEPFAVLTY